MPSPSSASSTTSVADSSQLIINALLAGIKWGGAVGTGATITYSFPWADAGTATFVGPNGSSDYSDAQEHQATQHYGLNSTEQAAATAALQAWASVANLTFTKSVDTSTTVGDIRFAWSSALPSTAGAWASYPNNYYPSGGDVWINANISSITSGSWSAGEFNYSLLMHEIGHALGLKHPFEDSPVLTGAADSLQYTVMSYTNAAHSLYGYITSSGNSRFYNYEYIYPDTPMVDDIAAIQYLYGANTSYMTGNNTYTFDSSTPFLRTIWDAGGTDTISVANFSAGCTIDLQAGHYSSITIASASTSGFSGAQLPTYDGTDNLGIAYGCVIENAIGGSGNDLLIGNDADNSLTGGAGNDTLQGGLGNDTAAFSGLSSAATITYNAVTKQATIVTAAGGTDTLADIEYASFSDKVVDLRTWGAVPDDYAATTATTGVLAVGGAATGSVETSGDSDWFAVTLAAGATYRFDQSPASGSALSPQVKIYSGSGVLLGTGTAGSGGASQLSYKATTAGTYYVSAGATNTSTGNYSVAAVLTAAADDYAATVATTGKLTVGGAATGSVETAGDADWFAVTLAAGATYRFDQSPASGSALSPQVKIYSGSGVLLGTGTAGSGGASQLSYKATTAGTYYVSAGATNTSTGNYSVAAVLTAAADDYAATTATTGAVAVGGSSAGTVETAGDADWFAVTLTAGATYRFDQAPSAGSALSAQVKIYDGNGALLATGAAGSGGTSQLSYKALTGGTYYVSAGALNTSTGGYSVAAVLTAAPDDFASSAATTGKLTVGGKTAGSVEVSGDTDWFAVTLAAGVTYRFDQTPTAGSALSSLVKMYDSTGALLATGVAGTGGASQLSYQALTGGTYYVSAGALNTSTGGYSVAAAQTAAADDYAATTATTGKLVLGSTVTGSVEASGDADWFAVTLTAGATYTFAVSVANGSALDPLLRLYNGSGTLLASDDDSGGGVNAKLTYRATASGTYYVSAGTLNSSTGGYTVTAVQTAAPDDYAATTATTGKLVPGISAAGFVETAGDADWFAVTLNAGATYALNLAAAEGSEIDPILRLYNSNGALLTSDDNSGGGLNARVTYSPVTAGTYYASASGAGNTIGGYSLSAGQLDLVAPVAVSFDPADGASNVLVNSNITVTFSENIKRGLGTLQLVLADGTVVETFGAATSPRLAINGATLTVDPTAALVAGKQYKLVVGAGAITDVAGNLYAGTNTYDFYTRSAPSNQPTTLTGTLGNDDLLAGSGNDTLVGSLGSDIFDGGAGLDVVSYQGVRSGFSAQVTSNGEIVVTKATGGQDLLAHVERLLFTDGAMAFDTGATGVAGQAYRMYQAAFDRAPDAGGLGFWIAVMDHGVSQLDVSAGFVNSPEFKALYGANPTNEDLLNRMYQNVLHRTPDAGGYAFWLNVLDKKLATVPAVLAAFSESPENQAALATLIGSGFNYQPYTGFA